MGLKYIDNGGREHAARFVRDPGCPENCSYECQQNFVSDERANIHRYFWSLNKYKKHEFYGQFVERILPKRKTVKCSSRRGFTFRYFFQLRDRRLRVCQKFFLNTLCVSRTSVYWYFKKIIE